MCPVPVALKDLSKVCPMFELLNEEALASDFVPKSKPYVFKIVTEKLTKVSNEHAVAACLKIYKITAAENQATQVIGRHSNSFSPIARSELLRYWQQWPSTMLYQVLLQICQRLCRMLLI